MSDEGGTSRQRTGGMSTSAVCSAPARQRGRPPIVTPNGPVRAFLAHWWAFPDLAEDLPEVESVFTGAVLLREQGDTATRPLSKARLFGLLRSLEVVSAESVGEILKHLHLSARSLQRYCTALRVISEAIRAGLAGPQGERWREAARAQREAEEAISREHGLPPAGGPVWCPAGAGLGGVVGDAGERWRKAGGRVRAETEVGTRGRSGITAT